MLMIDDLANARFDANKNSKCRHDRNLLTTYAQWLSDILSSSKEAMSIPVIIQKAYLGALYSLDSLMTFSPRFAVSAKLLVAQKRT